MSDDKRIENTQSPRLQHLFIKHMTTAHIAEALVPNAAPAASEPAPAADTNSPQPDAK
jgi:hypothetical protein